MTITSYGHFIVPAVGIAHVALYERRLSHSGVAYDDDLEQHLRHDPEFVATLLSRQECLDFLTPFYWFFRSLDDTLYGHTSLYYAVT